jgi:hypothetical protein
MSWFSTAKPTLFDAIEFDDEISSIDVLYDVAFLLMGPGPLGLPVTPTPSGTLTFPRRRCGRLRIDAAIPVVPGRGDGEDDGDRGEPEHRAGAAC